jgi:hypothetical protein
VLHHLAPLLQLRSLRTEASFRSLETTAESLAFFYCTPASSMHWPSGQRLTGGRAELERRLVGQLIDDEEAAVSDAALSAQAEWASFSVPWRSVFVKERLFDGRDGREAFMDWLQRRNATQDEHDRPLQEAHAHAWISLRDLN